MRKNFVLNTTQKSSFWLPPEQPKGTPYGWPWPRGWPGLTKVYLQPFGGRSVTVNLIKITLNYMLRITLYIWETVFPKNGIEAIGILKIRLRIPNQREKTH